jgi:hypothetical protein
MEQQTLGAKPEAATKPRPKVAVADPAYLARRRLIEWCERHELPVPTEPSPPRH